MATPNHVAANRSQPPQQRNLFRVSDLRIRCGMQFGQRPAGLESLLPRDALLKCRGYYVAPLPSGRRMQSGEATANRQTFFQRYKQLLRAQPASHLTSFLVLHEITAVLPLPLIFYALHNSDIAWDTIFPKDWLEKGDVRMRKTFKALGLPDIEEGSKAALNAAATYGIVKAAMPLRCDQLDS